VARRRVRRWMTREIAGTLMVAVILIATSGRWDWAMGWLLVIIYAASFVAQAIILLFRNPELLAERSIRINRNTKPWDRILLRLYGLVSLATLTVAGLDLRSGRGSRLPFSAQLAGLALAILGNALLAWAMAANTFFAFSVRLQKERGQSVITTGPYRLIRHPGYAGAILVALGTGLLLGSVWALIPAFISAALLGLRTALEDRTLRTELKKYAAYAQKTRFRLLPRVW